MNTKITGFTSGQPVRKLGFKGEGDDLQAQVQKARDLNKSGDVVSSAQAYSEAISTAEQQKEKNPKELLKLYVESINTFMNGAKKLFSNGLTAAVKAENLFKDVDDQELEEKAKPLIDGAFSQVMGTKESIKKYGNQLEDDENQKMLRYINNYDLKLAVNAVNKEKEASKKRGQNPMGFSKKA